MSQENADPTSVESLVSRHIINNPDLKKNWLFWKLVKECAKTIARIQSAGKDVFFVPSHSFTDGNRVTMMIIGAPLAIFVEEVGDGRLRVRSRGITDDSVETGADLLDYTNRLMSLA